MRFVQFEINGPVCTITMNRPDKRNAVHRPMAEELRDAFLRFERDEALRVAVLTGSGGHFCAGADLAAVADPGLSNELDFEGGGSGPMGPTRLELNKPLIAAISGYAVAGGLELALMADLRVADESSVFGVFCRRWGVPLIDGGTVRLPRMVGMGRALDMILTGRPVKAEEALSMGLANRLVPAGQALEAARALAQQLATFPQQCMRADRASAYAQWDMTLADALRSEGCKGAPVVSAEGADGAAHFIRGEGRHGQFCGDR